MYFFPNAFLHDTQNAPSAEVCIVRSVWFSRVSLCSEKAEFLRSKAKQRQPKFDSSTRNCVRGMHRIVSRAWKCPSREFLFVPPKFDVGINGKREKCSKSILLERRMDCAQNAFKLLSRLGSAGHTI